MYPQPLRIFRREEWIDVPGVGYTVLTGDHYFEDGIGRHVHLMAADPVCPHRCDEGLLSLPEADDTPEGWALAPYLCPCQQTGYVSPSETMDYQEMEFEF